MEIGNLEQTSNIDVSNPVVCLIQPPGLFKYLAASKIVSPPLGIAYLAGALIARDFKTQIIDGKGENLDQILELDGSDGLDKYSVGLSRDEIVERIDARADIIGISCMFSSSWLFDRGLIRFIRKRFPDSFIVLGGEHATACAEYILSSCEEVNLCVQGEGEETLVELVDVLRGKGNLSSVSGIVYRSPNGIENTSRRERVRDVDDIPRPAWDLVPMGNYFERKLGHGFSNGRNMPIMATRGCPYQCTFCSSPQMWTTTWIARDPIKVVDEMEYYIEKYGAENFDFYDLTAIIRKDWILIFARELLRRNLKITYQLPTGTRTEAIDEEVVELLYKTGCIWMSYAPESGSPETLKHIKKKIKICNVKSSIRAAYKHKLKIMVNLIIFPNDTPKDVWETFKFMLRCSWLGVNDMVFAPFVPYPGTELYKELVQEGRILDLSDEYFSSIPSYSDFSTAISYNPNFSNRQIQILRLLFELVFYLTGYLFRPGRFFSNLKNILISRPTTRGEEAGIQIKNRLLLPLLKGN